MRVGVPSETAEAEKRVALSPDGVKAFKERGLEVMVQTGAGRGSDFEDEAYRNAGAEVVGGAQDIYQGADLVVKVLAPRDGGDDSELAHLRDGSTLISFLYPGNNLDSVQKLAAKNITAFAMELIPRITRAQSMDVLSSMATIAGYRGALLGASHLPKFFPMLMTAAGTLPPARVFVIGAGVAGLQAIATCKRLGAIVEAFDVRPAVKEQVESLGARFVAMDLKLDDTEDAGGYAKEVSADTHLREMEFIGNRMSKNDVVITTALIPGKPAPKLITKDMVRKMASGSVIVDLAAPAGGNCEATVPGETTRFEGVTVIGSTSLLSDMAADASRMYSKNITEFVFNLVKEGAMNLDLEDPIIRDTLVTYEGKVLHVPTRIAIEGRSSS